MLAYTGALYTKRMSKKSYACVTLDGNTSLAAFFSMMKKTKQKKKNSTSQTSIIAHKNDTFEEHEQITSQIAYTR